MDKIVLFLNRMPLWVLITAAAIVAVAIIAAIVLVVLRNKRFRRALESALDEGIPLQRRYGTRYLKSRSKVLVKIARDRGNSESIYISGLAEIWLQEYKQKRRMKILRLMLEFIPGDAMFPALQAGMEKKHHVKLILDAIKNHGVRDFALGCRGERFDGKDNLAVLADVLDEIRELAGDPEWVARYVAIVILLQDDSERSLRPVVDAFNDSHPLIRKTVISTVSAEAVEELYEKLESSLIHDAAYEVRAAAWERIQKEFLEQYQVDIDSLSNTEAFHMLDFLDSSRDDHIDLAIRLLCDKNLELRHPAAVFLEQSGWLINTLNKADFSDSQDMERRLELLSCAAEVRVNSFLMNTASRPASLYLALKLLEGFGDRMLIPSLAERAFNSYSEDEDKLWQQAVSVLNSRPSDSGTALLVKEMDRYRYNSKKISFMLENLKVIDDGRIGDMLISLLTDTQFHDRISLFNGFANLDLGTILPQIKDILRNGRKHYPHEIRINALQVLAARKLPYMVQMILEQLPTLPLDEARDFATMLQEYASDDFSARIDALLDQPDGKIRAAVIASIPISEKKRIIKIIRAALKDGEPDVRVAAVWALVEIEETRTINQSLDMLRDPVERVRIAAAKAIGTYGSEASLGELRKIIDDENEVDSVKKAAISGLGASLLPLASEILVDLMNIQNTEDVLFRSCELALSADHSAKRISQILEHMKDASPELRDKLIQVFILIGEDAEPAVRELLEEDLASLKPYLIDVLEQTGYIEAMIRKMSNRDPRIRRNAADFLSKVGSLSAFRGIVLAARDPDEEVRVQVTRALEYLGSDQGKELLGSLREDPDRKVRKYTEWALQRLKAKDISDEEETEE